ncbi:hypothetical protein TTRE_0000758201 [Trichuris trichiura]|uniref:Uncharacterized protein n=1 Tax=Trichuris trichiura TaxID=36087 RepID=A0A077ZFY3_TRITR|nr:hypothetical protein TTRE_0000758201 [Trichuris trichiura]
MNLEFVNRTLPIYSVSDDNYDWSTVPIGTLPWGNNSVTHLRLAQEMACENTDALTGDTAKTMPIMEFNETSDADNASESVQQSVMEADDFNLDEYGCYKRRKAVDVAAISQRVFDRIRCGFGECL